MNKILDDLVHINIRLNESFAKTVDILNENIKLINAIKKDVNKMQEVINENKKTKD
tara:strand:+ start:570 stop:737 length:168 start_codon:yes stop_codon:yes gene_type:complete